MASDGGLIYDDCHNFKSVSVPNCLGLESERAYRANNEGFKRKTDEYRRM